MKSHGQADPDAPLVRSRVVRGVGFPARAGGPIKAAEMAGLPRLVRQMCDWPEDDPVWFAPPLLEQAARFAGGLAAVESPRPAAVTRG